MSHNVWMLDNSSVQPNPTNVHTRFSFWTPSTIWMGSYGINVDRFGWWWTVPKHKAIGQSRIHFWTDNSPDVNLLRKSLTKKLELTDKIYAVYSFKSLSEYFLKSLCGKMGLIIVQKPGKTADTDGYILTVLYSLEMCFLWLKHEEIFEEKLLWHTEI